MESGFAQAWPTVARVADSDAMNSRRENKWLVNDVPPEIVVLFLPHQRGTSTPMITLKLRSHGATSAFGVEDKLRSP